MTNSLWVTLHICEGSLMTSFPITNRLWVTLHILWMAVSWYLFLWLTASEWHCTFCERQSHHIFSYDQQDVSDIAHFVKGCLITSFPITNSKWVTLHTLWNAVSSHMILSYEQQFVSGDIAHFVNGSLITSFPMTNRVWVILHILWKAVWLSVSFPINSKWVILHILWKPFSFPMINSLWVILHILWKTFSLHLFLWPTASKWHCTLWKVVSSHIFLWPTACESDCTFLWKVVSFHLFLWPTACEWYCKLCERQSHHIFSYDQCDWTACEWHCKSSTLLLSIPQFMNTSWTLQWYIITVYILCISESEHDAISFSCLCFTLLWSQIVKLQLTHSHWWFLSLISLFLISRWVMLVNYVLSFISVCKLVCRSDNTLGISYSIS